MMISLLQGWNLLRELLLMEVWHVTPELSVISFFFLDILYVTDGPSNFECQAYDVTATPSYKGFMSSNNAVNPAGIAASPTNVFIADRGIYARIGCLYLWFN